MPWIKLDSSRSGSPAAQDGQGGRAVAGRQQLVRDVTRDRSGAPVSLRGQARCAAGSALQSTSNTAAQTEMFCTP
jgi:hypothetical protein